MKPRILVACEYSGRVRDEFAARGWDAWSCDFEPSDTVGQHYRGDVRDLLTQQWDMMIAFPPCTYLCSSGMHWTTRGIRDPKLTEEALEFVHLLLNSGIPRIAIENPVGAINTRICKPSQMIQPWQFGDDASKRTCLWLKNLPLLQFDPNHCVPPRGYELVRSAYDMLECEGCGEPYCPEHEDHYENCPCIGPDEEDVTIRVLDGVRFATRLSPAPAKLLWANQTPSGQNKLGPSPTRWKERSKTYPGIARAMADQWGSAIHTLPDHQTRS